MPSHPRLQHFFWNGLLLAAGLVIVIQSARLLAAIQAGVVTSSDFCPDYETARHWLSGAPIYTPVACWSRFSSTPQPLEMDSHPPPSLLLLAPFALLSYAPASWLWGLFDLACLLASFLVICHEVGLWSARSVLPLLALFLLWDPTLQSTRAGNISGGLLCLLIALAWRALRRGQQSQAGILVGITIATKLLPILLLPYFLLRRQWRAALSASVTCLVSILITLPLIGPRAWLDYLGPVRANEGPAVAVPGNLSLEGWIARLGAGYHEFLHPGAPRAFIDLAPLVSGLSLSAALLLGYLLAGLLILLASLWLWQRRPTPGWSEQDDAGLAFILILTFLIFPRAWDWNLVLLAMPLLWLAVQLVRHPASRARWYFGAALIVFAIPFNLLTPTFQWYEQTTLPWPARLAALMLTMLPTLALLLLLLALRPWLRNAAQVSASQQVPGEFLTPSRQN